MKSAKSESIFDWLDTQKSQNPELIRAARSKVNLEAIWSNWSGWSDCETKYGETTRSRKCRRSVINQSKSSNKKCLGLSRETLECSEIYCNKNDCTKENFQIQSRMIVFLKSTISRLMKKARIWNFKKVNSWRDFFRVKNLNITYVDANEMYGFGNEETIGLHNHTENVVQG